MKTIQEVMEKYHLTKKEYELSEGGSYYTVENIEAAMAEYTDQFKVKNLVQPDVSGRSELLAAFFDYIKGEVPSFRLKDINTERAVNDFLKSRQ